jgi:hypothetical protein
MSGEEEHQHVKDLRLLNSYPEDLPQAEVFKREAARLAVMDPVSRQHHIRATENRVQSYDANSNLRQQTQGFRLTQTLKLAHERLKAAGR